MTIITILKLMPTLQTRRISLTILKKNSCKNKNQINSIKLIVPTIFDIVNNPKGYNIYLQVTLAGEMYNQDVLSYYK